MTNEEKAKQITWQLFDDGHFYHNGISQRKEIEKAIMTMAQWKDAQYAEVLAQIAEANEQSKMAIKQIRQNLEKMYKINNQ